MPLPYNNDKNLLRRIFYLHFLLYLVVFFLSLYFHLVVINLTWFDINTTLLIMDIAGSNLYISHLCCSSLALSKIETFLLQLCRFIATFFCNSLLTLVFTFVLLISRLYHFQPSRYWIFMQCDFVGLVLILFGSICQIRLIFIRGCCAIYPKTSWMLIFVHCITKTLFLITISLFIHFEWYQWISIYHPRSLSMEESRFWAFLKLMKHSVYFICFYQIFV